LRWSHYNRKRRFARFSLLPDIPGAILIAVGIVGLAAFLWWETRAADPLLNVDLLRRNRVFAFSNAAPRSSSPT